MGRIIIQNATVLTLDDHDSFYYPGYVEIRDDRIYKSGQWTEETALEEYEGNTEVIDGTDKLVMPGMVDLHFHTSIAKVSHHRYGTRLLTDNGARDSMMTCHSGNI